MPQGKCGAIMPDVQRETDTPETVACPRSSLDVDPTGTAPLQRHTHTQLLSVTVRQVHRCGSASTKARSLLSSQMLLLSLTHAPQHCWSVAGGCDAVTL